ncbi:MAG: hypothetical protein C6I00_02880 [Nitratiruptor sp.]|nr:hypothetical protein [Nitratiruptor sp.]NPA82894.1 hypothetical protein [Campylobacterota bacterium]
MRKSSIIARFTLKEGLRDRFIAVLLAFYLFVVAFAYYFANFSTKWIDISFAINLLALFYYLISFSVIFFVPMKVSYEMAGNMALIYRSKPIHPVAFIAGKYGGYGIVVGILVLIAFLLSLIFIQKPLSLLAYFLALYLEQLTTLAAALLFGIYTSAGVAVLLTFMFYFLAHSTYEFAKMASESPVVEALARFFYTLFPSYDFYDLSALVVYGVEGSVSLWQLALYSLIYIGAILAIASYLFRSKEL